jgi:hypothetical protein
LNSKIKLSRPDLILIWIDEHIEESFSVEDIKYFIGLLKSLKENTGAIYNIHGGYLSVLLCHQELNYLNGVGHGINYGEHRPVIPIGGGFPLAKFFFPSIHSRLKFSDALGIIDSKNWHSSQELYLDKVCSCVQCVELIEKNESVIEAFFCYGDSNEVSVPRRSGAIYKFDYPTAEAKQAASRHYLYCKAREFEEIGSRSLKEILNAFSLTYNEISSVTGNDFISNLYIWKAALEKHSSQFGES